MMSQGCPVEAHEMPAPYTARSRPFATRDVVTPPVVCPNRKQDPEQRTSIALILQKARDRCVVSRTRTPRKARPSPPARNIFPTKKMRSPGTLLDRKTPVWPEAERSWGPGLRGDVQVLGSKGMCWFFWMQISITSSKRPAYAEGKNKKQKRVQERKHRRKGTGQA